MANGIYNNLYLYPIKLITQSPVVGSLRTMLNGGGFNETPAQTASAAATTLYMSYYDLATPGFTTDWIHLFNPGPAPASGTVSAGGTSPFSQPFSLSPGVDQFINFSGKSAYPLLITPPPPLLPSHPFLHPSP